jgi:hypothetical protein
MRSSPGHEDGGATAARKWNFSRRPISSRHRTPIQSPVPVSGVHACGRPGGNAIVDFDTRSITPVTGTAIIGHVFASLQVPVVNPDTTTNFVDHPLPGVLISVIGAEQEMFTTTDAQGFFRLSPCPAGRFFVSIDGPRACRTWPSPAITCWR